MSVTVERPPAPDRPASHERQLAELWAMTAAERVAAMWEGRLTNFQLGKWSGRHPDEVPRLGREFAWIARWTPEWCEATDSRWSASR